MKRYTVDKAALAILGITSKSAVDELGQSKVITDEALHFDNLPFASVVLTDEQVEILKQRNISFSEEATGGVMLGADYEKQRSVFFKIKKKAITGKGVKVAVIDTGCNTDLIPVSVQLNVIDANPGVSDVYGHGTRVVSIIRHSVIGLAPDCEIHMIKAIDDTGHTTEAAMLAAFDYLLTHDVDFVNCSWTFYTSALATAIQNVAAKNTIICAASGNTSSDDVTTLLPAALGGVVAVNAVNEAGQPVYRNIQPPPGFPGTHGITVACSGIATESYSRTGVYSSAWGTSFACPFFVGTLACYKEELRETDNRKVLDYVLRRAAKTTQPQYFGAGIASF